MKYARRLLVGKQYTQDDLIPLLILVIKSLGGTAKKQTIDDEMYDLLSDEFSKNIWHETVSHNVPRWQHDIAWAKERARQHHYYVKSAKEAGHGIWQLTKKGEDYANDLIKQLESSKKVIRRRKASE
jgi:hypothetical protein